MSLRARELHTPSPFNSTEETVVADRRLLGSGNRAVAIHLRGRAWEGLDAVGYT